MTRYDVILADPPWRFDRGAGARASAEKHYGTMTPEDVRRLDPWLAQHAAPISALFLWVPSALLAEGLAVMSAWGYVFRTVAFVWVKLTERRLDDRELAYALAKLRGEDRDDEHRHLVTYGASAYRPHFGMGHYTRAGAELCLLGTRGSLERVDRGVPQVVLAPVREHSRKPDEVQERIERLYPGRAYLELFARHRRTGWAAWGDEVQPFAPENGGQA